MKNLVHVEDDRNIAELLQQIFERNGFYVFNYYTVEDFNLDRPKNISLIVTDGQLGIHSAYNVLGIRNQYYKDTPIILYSGSSKMVDDFRSQGLEAYLKVDDNKAFFQRIKEYGLK